MQLIKLLVGLYLLHKKLARSTVPIADNQDILNFSRHSH